MSKIKGYKHYKLSDLDKEWLDNFPKTINENGCWIPQHRPKSTGYVSIVIDEVEFVLSRLSMCIIYNLDYYDYKIEARHSTGCSRACFWYEHLKPGTASDNINDSVRDKTHFQSSKKCCPKCGGDYKTRIIQSGWSRGQVVRYCPSCKRK